MKSIFIYLFAITILFMSCGKEEPIKSSATNDVTNDTPFVNQVEFNSGDGLVITADQYHIGLNKPVIVLCHQEGFSRGEYIDIADSLNQLGFNCLAVDLRKGNQINGVVNETHKRAVALGKGIGTNTLKSDINSAVNWASNYYNKNVILWGSMYSASISLLVATECEKVERVLAFSPRENVVGVNVKLNIFNLRKPVFLTSAVADSVTVNEFYNTIRSTDKTRFLPQNYGDFGSKALWKTSGNHREYWWSVKAFLGV